MRLESSCTLEFTCSYAVPTIFMLRSRSGRGQFVVEEQYSIEPSVYLSEYQDSYGNLCQRVVLPPGKSRIQVRSVVDCSPVIDVMPGAALMMIDSLPDETLLYLLPSRYCESDKLGARAMEIVSGAQPGYDQVAAICRWIRQNMAYEYGISNSSTGSCDALALLKGVCRDFAHMGISFCRSLDIPARIVTGYLYGLNPMDMHAWFEAYVGGRWYTFDPTQDEPRGGRIVVAYGRDAADVAFASNFGEAKLDYMQVTVQEVGRLP